MSGRNGHNGRSVYACRVVVVVAVVTEVPIDVGNENELVATVWVDVSADVPDNNSKQVHAIAIAKNYHKNHKVNVNGLNGKNGRHAVLHVVSMAK